ncbi:MAG: MgtC/SapB family protein [Nocardioidaceae bacterium]
MRGVDQQTAVGSCSAAGARIDQEGKNTVAAAAFSEPFGQGWVQVGELALAFVLPSLIGLERELRQKSAGLRTHTIVGVATALVTLLSKYGFTDVLGSNVTLERGRRQHRCGVTVPPNFAGNSRRYAERGKRNPAFSRRPG